MTARQIIYLLFFVLTACTPEHPKIIIVNDSAFKVILKLHLDTMRTLHLDGKYKKIHYSGSIRSFSSSREAKLDSTDRINDLQYYSIPRSDTLILSGDLDAEVPDLSFFRMTFYRGKDSIILKDINTIKNIIVPVDKLKRKLIIK